MCDIAIASDTAVFSQVTLQPNKSGAMIPPDVPCIAGDVVAAMSLLLLTRGLGLSSARAQLRGDTWHGRDPAPYPHSWQGKGHGHDPHRQAHICCRSRANGADQQVCPACHMPTCLILRALHDNEVHWSCLLNQYDGKSMQLASLHMMLYLQQSSLSLTDGLLVQLRQMCGCHAHNRVTHAWYRRVPRI